MAQVVSFISEERLGFQNDSTRMVAGKRFLETGYPGFPHFMQDLHDDNSLPILYATKAAGTPTSHKDGFRDRCPASRFPSPGLL